MIRAVLLVLGGPVFNEDAEYCAWTSILLGELQRVGLPVSKEMFERVLQEEIARCESNPWLATVWRFVRPDITKYKEILTIFRARNEEFQRELPGVLIRPEAKATIPRLAEQYLLALAANQPRKALELLEHHGLLQHFHWPEVSETMMLQKPQPLFFRVILDALGVQGSEAVMVGDRLDHDIFPARLLGLYTVRVLLGPYKNQAPLRPCYEPHLCVDSLSQLPQVLTQFHAGPRWPF